MTNRYICIHGHFYQPPRENPWLEDIELQDSAYPYHDWNEKITEECYRQNAASRILGPDKKIIDIINNYARISFDFGPTLMIWLEKYAPDVYESVLEADRLSMKFFSGHGAAIAQAYNHMIMPLANARDKRTQIIWGIRDFEHRFQRQPEGMWLPETAVDMETLDILAENNIKFTILAPGQARQVRKLWDGQWNEVEGEKINTTRPYLCRLASGRTISLFFYQGPVSQSVAYGSLLRSGENFAAKLVEFLDKEPKAAQLAHIATDGETYGHHYRNTDMALAYCLHYVESQNLAKITVYGEFLEKFPPEYEVQIKENTSWSCAHGVERWRSNCGCAENKQALGKQQWRQPLREAMDRLRDQLAPVYEDKMSQFTADPWDARNKYISVVNDRNIENIDRLLSELTGRENSYEEKIALLKLLEMQRNAMLMYTSCGWYFDNITGIETVQIMHYASRTIQLAKELGAEDFEPEFMKTLEKAPCSTKGYSNGREVYQALIKTASIDLNRVGAHLALSSIFEQYKDRTDIYCYSIDIEAYEHTDAGIQKLAAGRAAVRSNIVLERHRFDFAVLYFGEHNLIGAVSARMDDQAFENMRENLKKAFTKGDTTEVIRIMNTSFSGNSYSLWHLFKDQQRRILYDLLKSTWQEIEASFQHIYEHNYSIMQIMRGMNIPLPKALSTPAEFILNRDLCREIRGQTSTGQPSIDRLRLLADEVARLSLQLDEATIRFEASHKINELMSRFEESPDDVNLLETIETTIRILASIVPQLDLQKAQNIFFALSRGKYPEMAKKVDSAPDRVGSENAGKWVRDFENLARSLGVVIK